MSGRRAKAIRREQRQFGTLQEWLRYWGATRQRYTGSLPSSGVEWRYRDSGIWKRSPGCRARRSRVVGNRVCRRPQ